MQFRLSEDELHQVVEETGMSREDATAVLQTVRWWGSVPGVVGVEYYPTPGYEPGEVGVIYSCGPGSEDPEEYATLCPD